MRFATLVFFHNNPTPPDKSTAAIVTSTLIVDGFEFRLPAAAPEVPVYINGDTEGPGKKKVVLGPMISEESIVKVCPSETIVVGVLMAMVWPPKRIAEGPTTTTGRPATSPIVLGAAGTSGARVPVGVPGPLGVLFPSVAAAGAGAAMARVPVGESGLLDNGKRPCGGGMGITERGPSFSCPVCGDWSMAFLRMLTILAGSNKGARGAGAALGGGLSKGGGFSSGGGLSNVGGFG
jgi:hypothetical protein